jgi:hypothetical protein
MADTDDRQPIEWIELAGTPEDEVFAAFRERAKAEIIGAFECGEAIQEAREATWPVIARRIRADR